MRRADHRGSWAGHGRLKNLTCCSSSLPFAPPRRAARALEKVLSVEPAPVPRADPGSGERVLPVCPAPGLPSARARGDYTLDAWSRRPCGSRPPRGRLWSGRARTPGSRLRIFTRGALGSEALGLGSRGTRPPPRREASRSGHWELGLLLSPVRSRLPDGRLWQTF